MKAKQNRLIRELRVPVQPATRPTPGKAAGLYLLELRSKVAGQGSLPKRRLHITVDTKGFEPGHGKLVKISHA